MNEFMTLGIHKIDSFFLNRNILSQAEIIWVLASTSSSLTKSCKSAMEEKVLSLKRLPDKKSKKFCAKVGISSITEKKENISKKLGKRPKKRARKSKGILASGNRSS